MWRLAFISYAHEDKDFVSRLAHAMRNVGIDVILDSDLLAPGDSFMTVFEQIGMADCFLPVLSKQSVRSKWVAKELDGAIIREIEESEFTIIPILKEKCSLPLKWRQALREKFWARFDKEPYDKVLRNLLAKLCPERYGPQL